MINQHLTLGAFSPTDPTTSVIVEVDELSATQPSTPYNLLLSFTPTQAPFTANPVGTDPITVVAPDLQNFPALVVLDHTANTITLLNNAGGSVTATLGGPFLSPGDGTFEPAATSPVIPIPSNPNPPDAVGMVSWYNPISEDFYLAVIDAGNDKVDLFVYGISGGIFTYVNAGSLSLPGVPTSLVEGDFGTGFPSLAVVTKGGDSVSIFLDGGAGLPAVPSETIPVSVSQGQAIVAGNFFGNNRQDLALLDGDTIELFQNTGAGNFAPPSVSLTVSQNPAANPAALVAAPFTGGPTDDLAVADPGDGTVANSGVDVFLNNGNGTFTAEPTLNIGNGPGISSPGTSSGPGTSALSQRTPIRTMKAPSPCSRETAPGHSRKRPLSSLGLSATRGLCPWSPQISTATASRTLRLSRIISTGRALTSPRCSMTAAEHLTPPTSNTFPVGQSPYSVATDDFNGDGNLDLVTVNRTANTFSILLGDGRGDFSQRADYPSGGIAPYSVVVRDFNGDGRPDLAIANYGTQNGNTLAQGTVAIFLGLGDGTFLLFQTTPVGDNPYTIVAGNFGNAEIDLATANFASNDVTILMGDGTGHFTVSETVPVGANPISLVPGDFGNDQTDLAVANFGSSDVTILLNDGTGHFTESGDPLSLEANTGAPFSITSFTQNGHTNLAVADSATSNVVIFTYSGVGQFALQAPNPVPVPVLASGGGTPLAIAVGVFDANGEPDLVTANAGGASQVSVLTQSPLGTFSSTFTGTASITPEALAIGDFNGDGISDIVVANAGSDDVSILFGLPGGGISNSSPALSASLRATPLLGDLGGNGTTDAVVLASNGSILFRPGVASTGSTFGPAQVVNAPAVPSDPATATGPAVSRSAHASPSSTRRDGR